MDYFLEVFLGGFLDDFGPFYRWGGRPLVLRERWDAEYQYSGRGGRQAVVTEGGVEDKLLVRGEGWEVDAFVTATDLWSFYCIIQIEKLFN